MLDHLKPGLLENVLEYPVRPDDAVVVFVHVEPRLVHVFFHYYYAVVVLKVFSAFYEES